MIKHPLSYLWTELVITLATATILLAVTLMSLRAATPYLSQSLPGLKYWVEFQVKNPVNVDEIEMVWQGSHLALRLKGITLLDEKRQQTIVTAETVDIVFNPLDSLINGKFKIGSVIIDRAQMRIDQQPVDGELNVAGLVETIDSPIVAAQTGWLNIVKELPINSLIIQNSDIHILDREGRSWPLADLKAAIHREEDTIQMRSSATLLGGEPAYFSMGADLSEVFSKPSGEIYVAVRGFELTRLKEWLPDTGISSMTDGRLGVEVWTDFKEGLWSDVQISLKGYDVSFSTQEGRVDDHFERIQGELLWSRQEALHQWRLSGHHFKVQQADNNWLTSGFQIDKLGSADSPRYHLGAQDVQLDMWVPFLARTAWLPAEAHYMLEEYEPGGTISYVHATLADLETDKPWYDFQFSGDDLSITQPELGYRFEGVNLRMSMDAVSGTLFAHTPSMRYFPTGHPKNFMELMNWESQLYWFKQPDHWVVQSPYNTAELGDGEFSGRFAASFDENAQLHALGILANLSKVSMPTINRHLPFAASAPKLREWLDESLEEGSIDNMRLVYRGDASDFSNNKAVLQAKAHLNTVDLNYLPEWPTITGLQGDISVENQALHIQVQEANLGEEKLNATVVIPDLTADVHQVLIDGQILGRIERVANILEGSPLEKSVGHTLNTLKPEGDLDLSLTLDMTFGNDKPLGIRGLWALSDATIQAEMWRPIELTQLTGDIAFSERHLTATGLRALWLGEPLQTSIDAVFDGDKPHLNLFSQGKLEMDKIGQWMGVLNSPIQGGSDYRLDLTLPLIREGEGGRLSVTSDLQGLEVNLPPPFKKTMEDTRALNFTVQLQESSAVGISVQYGSDISLAQRFQQEAGQWLARGGHLNFGEHSRAAYHDNAAFLIDGYLPALVAKDWAEVFSSEFLADDSSQTLEWELEPRVNLEIGEVDLWGLTFPDTTLQVTLEKGRWLVDTIGENFQGRLAIPEVGIQKDLPIDINMQTIRFPDLISAGGETRDERMHTTNNTTLLPPINFYSEHLYWRDLSMNGVTLNLEPTPGGYRFSTIAATGNNLQLQGKGYWDLLTSHQRTHLEASISSPDIGEMLRAVHYPSAIRDAQGNLSINLLWLGGLGAPQWGTLSGHMDIMLKDGRILGIEPGMGRILSLLSLSNIKRRLTLDFSDITNGGFAFDKVNGDIDFDKQWVSTSNLVLRGPIANIDFIGRTSLIGDNDIEAEMIVSPNVSGTIPLAITIASGNPAIGAALWVFNKVTGNDLNEIIGHRYALSGNWKAPEIEELEIIREKTEKE